MTSDMNVIIFSLFSLFKLMAQVEKPIRRGM